LTEADQAGTDRETERAPSVEAERGARPPRSLAALWANARRLCARHPRRARCAAALAVYAAYECVLRAFAMPMVLYWGKMQLIDRAYLLAHPVDSLIYLHSQPPVLNALTLIVLHLSDLTGISEAAVASGLFAVLAFGCFSALLKVARLATGSEIASAACGALLLLNPAFAFYRFRLLYEIPALLAVLLVSWSWLLFLKDGRRAHWVALMFSLALLCATKSLFHPLLALLVALLALGARRAVNEIAWSDLVRRYAAGFVLGAVLVLLWPAKNQLVFDHFVYSSWLGFNLTVRTPVEPYEPFADFREHGRIHPSIQPQVDAFEGLFPGDDLSIVLAVKKPSFEKLENWNHLVVLYTNAELTRRGIEWRLRHPVQWMRLTAGRYFMTMRPSFVFPYGADGIFPGGGPRYSAYAARYRDIVHPNFRPWFESAIPDWFVHRYAVIRDQAVPYTLYAFVYPLFLLACAGVAVRKRREPIGWMLALCALMSAWTIIAPALTDGMEGNRMRLAATPLVCVGAFALLQLAVRRLLRARGV
jgi:4-amino-4-deoxy-L-arabinose transferase-like glycosyltransferase